MKNDNKLSVQDILAKDIMITDVLSVYEGWSIKRLSKFFVKHKISGAPVIASDHELVGVVSASDVIKFEGMNDADKTEILAEYVYPESLGQNIPQEMYKQLLNNADEHCTVHSIMTSNVISVTESDNLALIAKMMNEKKIRRVFVTENGVMVGLVSSGTILSELAKMI